MAKVVPSGTLNDMQKRFVEEYLIDLNATQAAMRAGYSQKTSYAQGCALLRHPEIQAALDAAMEARSERVGLHADAVLREYMKIAFADMRNAVRWGESTVQVESDEDGTPQPVVVHDVMLKSSDEIDDATAAAISEVSRTQTGIKIKFHDKKGALDSLAKHLGLTPEKLEHSGPNGGPIKTETNLSALPTEDLKQLQKILAKAKVATDSE